MLLQILAIIAAAGEPALRVDNAASAPIVDRIQIDLSDVGDMQPRRRRWIYIHKESSGWKLSFGEQIQRGEMPELLAKVPTPERIRVVDWRSRPEPSEEELRQLGRFTRMSGFVLRRYAGDLAWLKRFPQITDLDLADAAITSDSLAPLQSLKRVRNLSLARTRIGDAGMLHLRALANLESLDLSGTAISDHGADSLRALTSLKSLAIDATHVSAATAAVIGQLRKLEELNASFTQIDSSCVNQWFTLSKLRELHLRQTRIDNSGAESLARLASLQTLDVEDTRVESAGATHLAKLLKLEHLRLRNTLVDDDAILAFSGHPSLKTINLDKTRISDRGLGALRTVPNLAWVSLQETSSTRLGWVPLYDLPHFNGLTVEYQSLIATPRKVWFNFGGTDREPLRDSPDGKLTFRIVSGTKNQGWVGRVVDKETGKPAGAALVFPAFGEISCHAFSPDGRYLATGMSDTPDAYWAAGCLLVWDIKTGDLLFHRRDREMGPVYFVTFQSDSRTLYIKTSKYMRNGP